MTSRLEKKIVSCFENKEFYEAHQVYRTLYSRWLSAGKYNELLELLYEGSNKLFLVNEIQSSIDLVDLFANVLVVSKLEPSSNIYSRLEQLLDQLIKHGGVEDNGKKSTVDARNKFINDAVTWSQSHATKQREKKRGLSELHARFAKVFWKNELWEQARNHMLVAEQPEEFAKFLVEMHRKVGDSSEDDLFIVLAVLQLLCLHRVNTAKKLLIDYGKRHPAIHCCTVPFPRPLMNFCYFLMGLIPTKNLPQFTALVEQYHKHLSRDPSYSAYLMKIGELFFGKRAPAQNGGLLGSLFKGLLGPEKKDEPEVFSDSDFDSNAMELESLQADDEDGFETADEDEPAPPSSSVTQKKPVVDTMDDLD